MMMLNSLELLLLSGIEEALPSGSSLLPPAHPALWLLLPPALILKNQKKNSDVVLYLYKYLSLPVEADRTGREEHPTAGTVACRMNRKIR